MPNDRRATVTQAKQNSEAKLLHDLSGHCNSRNPNRLGNIIFNTNEDAETTLNEVKTLCKASWKFFHDVYSAFLNVPIHRLPFVEILEHRAYRYRF